MTKHLQGKGGQSSPLIVRRGSITEMQRALFERILWSTRDELAYYSSIDTMAADVLGIADTCNYQVNIGKDLWLTQARWNTLIRQYIDPELLYKFLEEVKRVSTYNRGIIALDTNNVAATVVASNPRANRRRAGACIRMFTYRAFPKPTISMYSRTSYLGYVGALDLLLANKVAEIACDMIGDGLKLDDMGFRWHVDVGQVHGFKCAAFIWYLGLGKLLTMKKWPHGSRVKRAGMDFILQDEDHYPTWKIMRNWWRRIQKQDREGVMYSDMKYGAEIRIRRRYHAMMGIDDYCDDKFKPTRIPNIPQELINLDQMLYKTPESRAIIRKKKQKQAKELVDALFGDDEVLERAVGSMGMQHLGKLGAYLTPEELADAIA